MPPSLVSKTTFISEDIGLKLEELEEAINVEIGWIQTTDKKIDDLLTQIAPEEKEVIDMNIKIYDVSFSLVYYHSILMILKFEAFPVI